MRFQKPRTHNTRCRRNPQDAAESKKCPEAPILPTPSEPRPRAGAVARERLAYAEDQERGPCDVDVQLDQPDQSVEDLDLEGRHFNA